MSGISLSLKSGRYASSSFSPAQISAVSSWFRVSRGTITGSGYSSIPDELNPSSPATQGTDADRPVAGTSANGLPILTCAASSMVVPLIAANNNVNTWGFWLWTRETSLASAVTWYSVTNLGPPDASLKRGDVSADNPNGSGRYGCNLRLSPSLARVANTANGTMVVNTWAFMTVEFDGSQATEAGRVTITKNGVPLSLTFSNSNGTPNDMPTALQAATGNLVLFSTRSTPILNPLVGNVGPNFGFFASKETGAAVGLLTTDSRNALMGYQVPT